MYSKESVIDGKLMAACVKSGAARLEKNEALINQLNVFPVPDGDTGSNMLTTLRGGLNAAKKTNHLGEYMSSLATGMLFGARGNSGVIFSQIFSGIAEKLKEKESATCAEMLEALENGSKVAYSSVVVPTEGTILTVVREGAEGFSGNGLENVNVWDFFKIYIENIKEALDKTPDLLPILKSAGVVDSGGYGFVKFFEGFTEAAIEGIASPDDEENITLPGFSAKWHDDANEEAFGFCTECIVTLNDDKNIRDEIVSYLTSMGQSVVCVQSGRILKLHVHTLEPLKVLNHMQELGVFYNVKIENMDNQVLNNSANAKDDSEKDAIDADELAKVMKEKHEKQVRETHHGIAYIAVANGDGVIKAFKDFGCEIVLNGGQTMNTSVEEFVNAFEKLDAEKIIVMPNNSNIEAAAKQAAKIYGEDRIMILPTKSIAEGYFAMSMAIVDRFDADQVYAQMKQGMEGVDTIWISKAIRDAKVDGAECREGDYLALYGKKIVASDPSRLEAVKKVLASTEGIDDKYVLLIFKGQMVTDEECEELQEYIEDTYDWLDVGIIDGGQDVYDFVIGITG
ncbi:MAG: DAK2 domain-containing protein [Lachnospiraceae bacterium]|nr:DAK2 domain-containing protein [Lachnospiraceae bacterium]